MNRRVPAPVRLALLGQGGTCTPLPAEGRLVVGSREQADLVLEDPYVSGRHAEIRADAAGASIEDLGSTNGTWVDGVRVKLAWLEPGTRVRIGRQDLTVVAADEPRDARAPIIVGRSPATHRLLASIRKLALLRPPVLVIGETGTGKELVARSLHDTGPRKGRPFVALNCAAIPESLAESQLFGHVRGAFTGANRPHTGAFARAHGGTLFLDEVGELAPALQAKLLRVLETERVSPVGSEHEIPVDVRVVCATHRDLPRMVAAGRMREDLFHRLGVFVLDVPPLRQRPEDIEPLIDHFLLLASRELGKETSITRAAVIAARRHPWPGNVRALRNAITRAAALADGPITSVDLLGSSPGRGASSILESREPSAIYVPRGDYASMHGNMLRQLVAEHGSIRRAAIALGIPRSTLGSWLKKAS